MPTSKVDQIWAKLKPKPLNTKMENILTRIMRPTCEEGVDSCAQSAACVDSLELGDAVRENASERNGNKIDPSTLLNSASSAVPVLSEGLRSACQRDLQKLSDADPEARIAAMKNIKSITSQNGVDEEELRSALQSWLGKSLIKTFADSSERVRTLAMQRFMVGLSTCPAAGMTMLPYLMPIMEERIGCNESSLMKWREPVEELRSLLFDIMMISVENAGTAVTAYTSEMVVVIKSGVCDSFPEVNIKACRAVQYLAAQLQRRMQPFVKEVVAAVLPLATHNRKAVRCAAVAAIQDAVPCGAHEMILDMVAWRDPNTIAIKAFYEPDLKVNFFGKLASDSAPAVRAAFLDMLEHWLLHLDERIDHQSRLLPYVISALGDEEEFVRERATATLKQVGELYEVDHRNDMKDIKAYLPAGAQALGYAEEDAEVMNAWDACSSGLAPFIPAVFCEQFCLGTRRVVTATFDHIAHALIDEVRSWQPSVSIKAIHLLALYLVIIEDHALQLLHEIVPALLACLSSPKNNTEALKQGAEQCCSILGLFLPFRLFHKQLQPHILNEHVGSGALEALAAYVRGAGPRSALSDDMDSMLATLQHPDLLGLRDPSLEIAFVHVLQAMVQSLPDVSLAAISLKLMVLLLQARQELASINSRLEPMSASSAIDDILLTLATRQGKQLQTEGPVHKQADFYIYSERQSLLPALYQAGKNHGHTWITVCAVTDVALTAAATKSQDIWTDKEMHVLTSTARRANKAKLLFRSLPRLLAAINAVIPCWGTHTQGECNADIWELCGFALTDADVGEAGQVQGLQLLETLLQVDEYWLHRAIEMLEPCLVSHLSSESCAVRVRAIHVLRAVVGQGGDALAMRQYSDGVRTMGDVLVQMLHTSCQSSSSTVLEAAVLLKEDLCRLPHCINAINALEQC